MGNSLFNKTSMKFKILALLILSSYSIHSAAQLKTYLGIEVGPAWDINRVSDPGTMLSQTSISGTIGGISLSQEIIPHLSIETGLSYHSYYSGINMDDRRPDNAGWKKFDAVLIPARIKYKFQFTDYPVSITPHAGYQYGRILANADPYTAISILSDPEANSIQYNLTENTPIGNSLHLIEFGLSTAYIFDNNWQMCLSLAHFSGLKELSTSDITINRVAIIPHTASYTSDGTRFQTTARLSIPISNMWENKDLRIRKKIENSGWSGRSTIRPQNYIYFGGDVGALWRSFQTSNPAVGSRPITGKGIFRYSNLHTGIYVGFLLKNNIGIDLGAYYQRSSLFFSLMYDHEVDFVTRSKAPMYLEFPLRFRYYYDVYKGRVLIVPTLGFSVLTHFSVGDYGAGSDGFSLLTLSGNASSTVNYSGIRSSRIGLMLKAGIGGEYRIPIGFPLYATAALEYNHGLKEIDEIQVSTSMNETPAVSTVKYLGSGWNFSIGARIPILLGKDNRKCGAVPMNQ
jgi:hypothetical protein